jgi:Zn-dependent peptidase ImmA (M78 family)
MYHPWRALRDHPDIDVEWTPLPDGILALTDGRTRIWIDPRQHQAKRRCTLAHELAHIELGHTGGCTHREDRAADQIAARRLIPLDRLADALTWARSLEEAAEELWVDVAMLRARLDGLHPPEERYLTARITARYDTP